MSDDKRERRPDRQRRGSGTGDERDRVRELSGPLGNVLKRLPEIERRVVEMRTGLVDGHPRNISETAKSLGMSSHEAKQVEERAFARIREVVPLASLQKYLSQ
jgi:RNA polymerase primary sigma factor